MSDKCEVIVGRRYKHFKGMEYKVLGIATHSETGEKLVIYQAQYGAFEWFARPYKMFVEKVDHHEYPTAQQTHRFELIEKC